MMCALLKTVLLNASVMIVITDVCDAIISSCPWNHSHHLKIDCFVCFLINFCRWLNYEDPLINHNPWTVVEDKNLLLIVQDKGINNWFDIAVSLGTNRTPFQCLARYQRSLNASILRREWTKDEDAQLCAAVDVFGESDWQSVASTLEGRTGTQCSNRWKKSLHPTREIVGRWIEDEDKRLKVAVMLFGPKNWNKIAQFVPGRTQVQCRERWVNSLDPALNLSEWTEEEDSRLKAAIAEHGYCWAKVAACVPPRTDNQCRRRWKKILPDEVPMLREARRIQNKALIANFVDRELERPALGPRDFLPLPMIGSTSEPENENPCSKPKGRLRGKATSNKEKNAASCNVPRKIKSKKHEQSQACSGITEKKKHLKPHSRRKSIKPIADNLSLVLLPESLESGTTNGECVEAAIANNSTANKKGLKHYSRRNKCTTDLGGNQNFIWSSGKSVLSGITNDEHPLDRISCVDSTLLTITNSEVVDSTNGHVWTEKKRATKLQSRRKKSMELAEDSHSFSSHPESGEFRRTDGEGAGSSFLDKGTRGVKLKGRRKRINEPSGECQDVSVPCQQDKPKISKRKNISPKQMLGATDGDNITLASFLHKKLKKRRCEVAENTDQACPPSGLKKGAESLSNEVDKLHNRKQMLSTTQAMVDMPSDNGPHRQDLVQGQNTSLHEPVSISLEGDCEEDDDVPLACLQNKWKNRRFEAAKTANQACSPSSVKKKIQNRFLEE